MWKFFSRGLRETFEKGFRIVRPTDATVKNDITEHTTYCRKFTPSFLETVTKYRCAGNEDAKKDKNRSTTHDSEPSIFGAVSCSSALVLGWFLTQPCHWRKWWNERNNDATRKKHCLINLLGTVASTQPVNLKFHSDSVLNVNSDNSDVVDGVPYGPKTAEEVLNDAAEELRAVHDSVAALSENSQGVDYISRNRHREAVAMFRSASRRGYAPAAYNLAQCYEMGLGIKQDFTEAAKWYRIASDKGHATAKYNLGVFYAHGWGGLEASSKIAKKLFEEAAAKGQQDAKEALHLNIKQSQQDLPNGSKDWEENNESRTAVNTNNNKPNTLLYSAIKNNDANEIYKAALSFESSACDDSRISQVVMQLHKKASDMGHSVAKARIQLLEAYEAIGLLQVFLCGKDPYFHHALENSSNN